MALKKFCPHRGCKTLVDLDTSYCDEHINDIQISRQQYNKQRPEWHNLYKSYRWRNARLRYLMEHPLCVECERIGRLISGNTINHIIPHKGNYDLFWNESNWETLCKRCHDRRTATYDGGFGNKVK
jgi:5-methylcytosine-specific restriction protein A